MFIEDIVERLNNPYLKNKNNSGRIVLDGTVGEYLEHFNNHFASYFICQAQGKYLDLHGREYGLIRREDESDTSFRRRILAHVRVLDTTEDFRELDVNLWSYDEDFSNGNVLVSRNTLLRDLTSDYIFIAHADFEDDKDYLENKYLLRGILWE